jgi:hypothetical protein
VIHDRDHVFSQLTQEQVNESRHSLLEGIKNEPDDRHVAPMTNAVEGVCASVTTKPTSPDDTSAQQVRSGNDL